MRPLSVENDEMALLNILHYPDERLRKVATEVDVVNDELRQLLDDMLETMYAAPGIGLAATQVNVQKRLLVVDLSEEKDQPLCFINPVITELEGTTKMEEGCLSVPGFYEDVKRAEKIKVEALDRDGNPFEMECDGLMAVCLQHEVDHLDGKLFVDHLSRMKRERIRKKIEKETRHNM